jgi:hypothetical protein
MMVMMMMMIQHWSWNWYASHRIGSIDVLSCPSILLFLFLFFLLRADVAAAANRHIVQASQGKGTAPPAGAVTNAGRKYCLQVPLQQCRQCRDPPKKKTSRSWTWREAQQRSSSPWPSAVLWFPHPCPFAPPAQPIPAAMLECSGPIGLLSASAPAS